MLMSRRLCLAAFFVATVLAPPVSAVTMEWVTVGDAGNACDPQSLGCFGDVNYSYRIGKYEVTNAQYSEFLNAVAPTDDHELFHFRMEHSAYHGGINRFGSPGSYTYAPISGRENMPVNYVSLWDSMRFINWLNNGQGNSSTEDGAYTLTELGISQNSITRNPEATVFLPNEDEWYKAAYFNSASGDYFQYPAASDGIICAGPGPDPNSANCDYAVGDLTQVGSYSGSPGPYGTFDQGGNVAERNETIYDNERGTMGGAFWNVSYPSLRALGGNPQAPWAENGGDGFRVASVIPEPSTALLLGIGLAGLGMRRRRAH